jgi:hypothetical protein
MVMVENFESISDNFDVVVIHAGESHTKNVNYYVPWLLLASSYKLKHLKESLHEKFFLQPNK